MNGIQEVVGSIPIGSTIGILSLVTRFHDISLPISESLITYPGDPPIELEPHSRIAEGDDANVTRLSFGTHTGTHLDAPLHFVDGGRSVDELALDILVGPARVVEIPSEVRAIGAEVLRAAGIAGETRILLATRNQGLLEAGEFRRDYAHLTPDAADYLLSEGVRLLGIDYLSVEAFHAEEATVHCKLLEAEVVILEGLDLRQVPAGRYELICLPLRLAGLDGAPARAILRELD